MKTLRFSQFLGGVLLSLLILFSLNCGGGGGASSTAESEVTTSEKVETTVTVDLNDFKLLESRQKVRSAPSGIDDIVEVSISVSINGAVFLKDFKLTHISGTIYEVTLQDLPIGETISFEISGKDSSGETVVKTMSETVLSENVAKDEKREFAVPISAVIEFQGDIFDSEMINNLIIENEEVSSGNTDTPVVEISDSSGNTDTPVVETPDSSGNTDTPVVETPDSSGNTDTPVIVTPDSSGNTDTPVVETPDSSGNTDTPVVETPDSSGNTDTPVVEDPDSSGNTDSPVVDDSDNDNTIDPNLVLLTTDELGQYLKDFSLNFKAYFSESDLIIRKPNSEEALLTLKPIEYGRAGNTVSLGSPLIATNSEEVTYAWSGFQAWYRKSVNGLEQGFTIDSSPSGEGKVLVDIAVDAESIINRGDSFVFETGEHTFIYDKLLVYDANNQELESSFSYDNNGKISILFDDTGALYPIVVDPEIQATQLEMRDTDLNGQIDQITINYDENITAGNTNTAGWTVEYGGADVTISSVSASTTTLTLSLDQSDGDLIVDTLGSSIEVIYDSMVGIVAFASGNVADNILTGDTTAEDTELDMANPILLSVDFTTLTAPGGTDLAGETVNAIQVAYSEAITLHTDGAGGGDIAVGNDANSTASVGGLSQGNLLGGLLYWTAVGGDFTGLNDTINQVELVSANVINVYLNTDETGYFSAGTTNPAGTASATAINDTNDVEDGSGFGVEVGSTISVRNSQAWDIVKPTVSTLYSRDTNADGDIDTVDVTFSSNIIDNTITVGSFEFDLDQTNNGSNESLANAYSTTVVEPSGDADVDDDKVSFTLTSSLSGSTNVFMHYLAVGLRDIAGNPLDTGSDLGVAEDRAQPVLQKVDFTQLTAPTGSGLDGYIVNAVQLIYSEDLQLHTNGAGGGDITATNNAASTAFMGNMSQANLLSGLASWVSTTSDMTNFSETDNYVELSSANVINVYLNAASAGYFDAGTIAPTNQAVSAIADANDLEDEAGLAVNPSSVPTVVNSIGWDVTVPTIDELYSIDSDNDGDINSVDVTFSENIFDTSLTASHYELDDDNSNDATGEVAANSVLTNVTYPSVLNVTNDEYINLSGASEISGSENVFLHIITQGARDLYGNRLALLNNTGNANDRAQPVLLSVDYTTLTAPAGTDLAGNTLNGFILSYSENVLVYTDGAGGGAITEGSHASSTATQGSMTSSNSLAGLISWAAVGGDMIGGAATVNAVERTTASTVQVYLNSSDSGFFSSGTVAPTNQAASAISDANDLTDEAGWAANDQSSPTETNTNAWDVTKPTLSDSYNGDSNNDGDIDVVDLVFSEDVLDNSITLGNFEIDNDPLNDGNGEETPTSYTTIVSNPAADSDENDEKFAFNLTTEITGSDEVYVHHLTLGLRDLAGNRLDVNDNIGSRNDVTPPVLLSVDFTQMTAPSGSDLSGNIINAVQLVYSENVILHTNGAGGSDVSTGASADSTNAVGGMTQGNLLSGLFYWTSGGAGGDMVGSANTVNRLEHSSENTINVYLNASNAGYFSSGTNDPTTPSVTAISDINDVEDEAGLAVNISNTVSVTNSISWDVVKPTITTTYSIDDDADGDVETLDVIFSENILDASYTASEFSFDNDNTNLNGSEKSGTGGSSTVAKPSADTDTNDEYYRMTLTDGDEIDGTELIYLHLDTEGLRDLAGNRAASGDALGTEIDCAGPALITVDFAPRTAPVGTDLSGNTVNSIQLIYSEDVFVSNNYDGGDDIVATALDSSTTTMGSMVTANLMTGLISWSSATGGDMENNSDTDNIVEHTSGNEVRVFLNANFNGYFLNGSVSPSGTPTVAVLSDNLNVRDGDQIAVNAASTPTVTVTAWDVTQPQASSIDPLEAVTINNYELITPQITFSENMVFSTNTEFYTYSGNSAFELGTTDQFLTTLSVTELGTSNVQLAFTPTGERFKSGSFDIAINDAMRDLAGNRIDSTAQSFTYFVRVTNIALYTFSSGNTNAYTTSWTSSDYGAVLSAGASGNNGSNGWTISGTAMDLPTGENFTIPGLDNHGFPQNIGQVEFWYQVPETPSTSDIVFGDQGVAGGNAITIRYLNGTGNTYRLTSHGAPGGNTLDFNLVLGSYNHIAFRYDHDNDTEVVLNGQLLSNNYITGEWFPNDQDVIFEPNGSIDLVSFRDTNRAESTVQVDFIPLTLLDFSFDSGYVSGSIVTDEDNDFDGTIYGSANLVEGHHLSGNSIHLRTSSMGFRPEDHGGHLFPHINTGTLEFWVNPEPNDGQTTYLIDEPDGNRDHFYMESTGNLAEYQFVLQSSSGGGTVLGDSTFTLQDQAWNHLVVTWNTSDNVTLFVNGSANYTYLMPGNWSLGGQIVGSTPSGYLDEMILESTERSSSNIQTIFDYYHIPSAAYSFDEEVATENTPWLNTNDVGIYYTTDTSLNRHRMFFDGSSVPVLDKPHYGDVSASANSIAFSGNSGFSVFSLESDFFPSEDGAYVWWWKPSFITGGNTVEALDTDDGGRDHFVIESIDSSGNFQFSLKDTSFTVNDDYSFQPIMERWNHMSIVWTSNSSDHGNLPWASFFLNGQEVWNQSIGTWRPVDQKTASTPYGSLDNFRVESEPWTSAQILTEYDTYIRNLEESSDNIIVFGFTNGEYEATHSHDSELLYDVDTSEMEISPSINSRYNAIHQSTTGHHGYLYDVDRDPTPTLDTTDTGAAEFEADESFWVPVSDKTRFPQDAGTLRFWYKPIWEYGNEDQVFGGNFVTSVEHENFFNIEETSNQGFYDFNIYEDGVLLGGLTNFELHRNTYNYVAVTWEAGGDIDLYINGYTVNTETMGTWRPTEQLFVSTPNGVLDMMYLEDTKMSESDLTDYYITYVTAAGFFTFEMDSLPDVVDQLGNDKGGTEYGAGTIVNGTGFDATSNYYLDLTAASSYLDIPGLVKDLFPQEEGVVRFWYDPVATTDNTTYVYDEPDITRNHFYIQSQGQEGYYRFGINSLTSSDNLAGYYDFYLDPREWSLVSFNWSSDEDQINFMVDGQVLYTTEMGGWLPEKQISVSTPNGLLDDFYISYEYESSDNINEYYHIYRSTQEAGSLQVWGDGTLGQLGNNEVIIQDTPTVSTELVRVTTSAGGSDFGVAILEDTKMWAWGNNERGQLGIGSTSTKTAPVEIDLWNGFYDVDAGDRFVVACLVNGNVIGWGDNTRNQLGFTSGANTYELSPTIFDNINDIVAVSCGNGHALAMDTVGNVYSWGANDYGQCGVNPSTATVTAPQMMVAGGGTPSPVQIDCGYAHSLVLFDDGSVMAYGLNGNGQLGDGTTTDSFAGVSVGLSTDTAIDIACGDEFSLALLNSNVVEAWGKNDNGQLADSDTDLPSSSTPSRVTVFGGSDLTGVTDVAAASRTGFAILSDGSVYSWGSGLIGQLGNGSRNITQEFSSYTIGIEGMYALGKAGTDHITAMLFRSTYYEGRVEYDVELDFDEKNFKDSGTTQFHGEHHGSPTTRLGRSNKGLAFDFEEDEYFQISDMSGNVFPQEEGKVSFWYQADASTPSGANLFDGYDLGRDHFYMQYTGGGNIDLVQTDGGLDSTVGTFSVNLNEWHFLSFTWQTNSSSLIIANNASTTSSTVAYGSWVPENQIVVSTPNGFLDNFIVTTEFVSEEDLQDEYTFGANASTGDYVNAWGANSIGELDDGTLTHQFSPVDVIGIDSPTMISVGFDFKVVLYPDGSMKALGENFYGQLGDLSTSDSSDLVNVSNNNGAVSSIASGKNFTVGLLSSGNVVAWGKNNRGQVGINSSASHFVNARLNYTVTDIVQISVGDEHALVLDSSGNVYAWGDNSYGQLGVGASSGGFEKSPVQVSISNVAEISAGSAHSIVRLNDGTVYTWGRNTYGQLGDGATAHRYTPYEVTTLSNITMVRAGGTFNVVMDTSDQIWLWGNAKNNSLSDTPTVLTTNSNISDVAVGLDHFIVLLNDNTVMSWGDNTYGQLGIGDSSTVSVSTLTEVPDLSLIIGITVVKDSNFVVGQ